METKFSVKLLTNLQVAMDKKTKKDAERKTERVKDRGDLTKTQNSKPTSEITELKNFMPDRGDSLVSQKSITKPIEKKKLEDPKIDSSKRDLSKREVKKEETPIQNRTYLDLEGRKCLRERYTLRFKSKNSDMKVETKESDIKNEKKTDDESTTNHASSKNSVFTEPRTDKKPVKEAPCSHRKPIIKTVTVKNDNRVYKAVTFVDQKKHTPLQINIPSEYKKKPKNPSFKVKLKLSKESLKEKPVKKAVKKKSRKKRVLSPELFTKRNASPPTEVAKWAPSCINHHTKPYYEAWVDTTLAAISKCSKKDKLYLEKQNIIRTFQKALLARPETPDLVYQDYHDERYTGRIKVRQR